MRPARLRAGDLAQVEVSRGGVQQVADVLVVYLRTNACRLSGWLGARRTGRGEGGGSLLAWIAKLTMEGKGRSSPGRR